MSSTSVSILNVWRFLFHTFCELHIGPRLVFRLVVMSKILFIGARLKLRFKVSTWTFFLHVTKSSHTNHFCNSFGSHWQARLSCCWLGHQIRKYFGYRNTPYLSLNWFSSPTFLSFFLHPLDLCSYLPSWTCPVLSLPPCVPSVRELSQAWWQTVLPAPVCQGMGIHAELIPGLPDSPQHNPHRGHITGPLVQLFYLECIQPIPFSSCNFPFRNNPEWLECINTEINWISPKPLPV